MGKCLVETCTSLALCRNLCDKHYTRWLRYGDPTKTLKNAPGMGSITVKGYKTYYKAGRSRFEYRQIMEDALGRKLLQSEEVHHKNGNRLDNRLENLELWVKSHPSGQRPKDLVAWAKEILIKYSDLVDHENAEPFDC